MNYRPHYPQIVTFTMPRASAPGRSPDTFRCEAWAVFETHVVPACAGQYSNEPGDAFGAALDAAEKRFPDALFWTGFFCMRAPPPDWSGWFSDCPSDELADWCGSQSEELSEIIRQMIEREELAAYIRRA